MRPFALVLTMILSLACFNLAQARSPYLSTEQLQAEAQKGFGEILDLWRDGRYGELFDRTLASGKGSREQFSRRLTAAPKKPACCWEKMQEVKVSVKNDSTVTLRAKVGIEGGPSGTEYVTKSFKLQKEDGIWRISQSDILSLAGEGKKRNHRKTIAKTP